MRLSPLARRNLRRNKRRTLITAFSVAFGVLLSVTFTASGDYSYTNMIDTSTAMGLGHLTVEPAGYNDSPSLDKRLVDAEGLEKGLLANPLVTAAHPRIMGQAMFASGAKNTGGMFIAIDPARESPDHNLFLRSIEEGELTADPAARSVVIGRRMAERLNLRIGKKIVITVTDKDGEMVGELGRVTGIFRTGDDATDSSLVLLPIAGIRKTLRYEPGAATLIAISIEDQRRTDQVRRELELAIGQPGIEVLSWRQTQADLAGLIAIDRASNYLMQFLVGLLIAAGILNTLLMSVLERTREFGMMMAIGMSPGQVMRLVLAESLWIGVLGIVSGIVLTAPWYIYMARVGIDLGQLVGDDYSAGGVLVDPVLKFRLFRESALAIVVAIFTLTMASGLYPAWRAGRITPVESLKVL